MKLSTDEEIVTFLKDNSPSGLTQRDIEEARELLEKVIKELYDTDIEDVGVDTEVRGQECSFIKEGHCWELPAYCNGTTRRRRCLTIHINSGFMSVKLSEDVYIEFKHEVLPGSDDGWGREFKHVKCHLWISYGSCNPHRFYIDSYWAYELESLMHWQAEYAKGNINP